MLLVDWWFGWDLSMTEIIPSSANPGFQQF